MLAKVHDPGNQSYTTYSGHVLLMVGILSSVFYISSMRKTSEEFNSDIMIENIGYLCGQELIELPYWETINNYLERIDPGQLQGIVNELVNNQQNGTRLEIKKGTDGRKKTKEIETKYGYVNNIDYMNHLLNFVQYYESTTKYPFYFLTNLRVSKRNVRSLAASGRKRWFIENLGFNIQKNHGYYLEHLFSHNYTTMKNHYYLMQTGHMISQIIEAWAKLWKKVKQSMEQKHRRLLEAWKWERIVEYKSELEKTFQVRFS